MTNAQNPAMGQNSHEGGVVKVCLTMCSSSARLCKHNMELASQEEGAWLIIRLVKNRNGLLRNAVGSSSSEVFKNKELFLPLGRRLDQTDS